MLMEPAPGWW